MSDKIDFRGDVGQAVMGDVNEGSRLSNVVNLHLGEAPKEEPRITDYQRKRINVLVKEWASICGDKEIEIYKIFIADFGIRFFRELPMKHYHEVKETLEGWIAAAKRGNDSKSAATRDTSMVTVAVDNSDLDECAACTEKNASFARAQRSIFAQWFLIFILTGLCGWLLYQMPTPADPGASDGHCYHEGKPYSAGSTIKAIGGTIKECIAAPDGRSMTWIRTK
ncbi:hypothetical protein [Herbaspirillum seropedicae]|uniref:hypothetical protein n=1 Tax=Herbaspirillum seropedicae TaxID=964 RepID=UPI003D97F751